MRALTTQRSAAGGGVVLVLRFVFTAVFNYGFGVALAWVLPRTEFGAVSVLQNVVFLAGAVAAAGVPWVVARTVARGDVGADAVVRAAMVANLLLGLLLAGAFVAAQAPGARIVPDTSTLLVVAVAVTVVLLAVNAVLAGALQGLRRFDAVGGLHTLESAVKVVVGLAAAVLLGWGPGGVAVGFAVGAVVVTVGGWWALRDRMPGPGPLATRATLTAGVPTGVGTTGFALLGTLDVIVLGAVAQATGMDAGTLAVYQAAVIVARAPYFVADSLADAVFPFMARGESWSRAHRWLAGAYRWILLGLVPLQVVLLVAPAPVVAVLFPAGYAGAAPLVQLLTLGTLGLVAAVLLLKALYARGLAGRAAYCTPVAVAVEAGMLTLVPRHGAPAAALAFTAGAWTCAVLLAAVYVRQHRPARPAARHVLGYLAALAALGAALVPARAGSVPTAVALIGAGLLGYAVIAVRTRLVSADEVARARVLAVRVRGAGARAARRLAPAAGLAAIGLLAAGALGWNLTGSPDTQYDEVVYTRAAQQVAQGGELTWTNRPMFVHPPLSFLGQAGWLDAVGRAAGPLHQAIPAARWLSAAAAAAAVVLLAVLAGRLMPAAGPRRRLLLIGVVAVLAALDPVLLRYGRLAIIEPFALLGCLATLLAAVALRRRRAAVWVAVVGLGTGLTLLTKEVAVFMLLTPTVHALLGRDRRRLGRAVAALGVGLGWWLLFPFWAVRLGLVDSFADVKFATAQRLLGLLQITGWNRPGASFGSAVQDALGQYASTYLLLATGAVALLWLLLHRLGESARWLTAWLLTSYGFGAYTVVLGTLNEQFFVFVVPAAIVGTVLVADAVLADRARRPARHAARRSARPVVLAAAAAVGLAGFAAVSWARFYLPDNDGVLRTTALIRATVPGCAAVNASGDAEKYAFLLPGRPVTYRASGPGAVSQGVHLFLLSDKDAAQRYGNATPQLNQWVRAHGTRLADFPSATYRGVQLWRVDPDPYDPLADVQSVPGGSFVHTTGSRCGGFPVVDGPTGPFASAWQDLGGKAVTGPPLTGSWSAGGTGRQVFDGAVLNAAADGSTSLAPIVRRLAAGAPRAYADAHLPPLTGASTVDRAFESVPARRLLGDPVGPATPMPDGQVRQAFAGGVLERPADGTRVRLADLGRLALDTGLVAPPESARRPVPPPPLPDGLPPAQPSAVRPFVTALAVAGAGHALLLTVVLLGGRGRRRPAAPAVLAGRVTA